MKKTKKILAGVLSAVMVVGSVAAPLSAFAAVSDQLKVATISDIQYQTGKEDEKGLILSQSGNMLDAAITKINAANPEVVLITGDLTNDGMEASHDAVVAKIGRMKDADTKVYVVPGEKDIKESGLNALAVTRSEFASIYAQFGYQSEVQDAGTLSYVALPKAGYALLMLDSVATESGGTAGNRGRGQINKEWALTQLAAAKTAGNFVIGAAHHPSISRGSVESTFIDLLHTVGNLKNAQGQKHYTDDPLAGLDLINKSSFAYADMQALSDAGLNHIFTGHNYMINTVTGTTATETEVGTTWNDYNVGSLVAASASITNTVFDKTAATPEAKAVTTVDMIETIAGEPISVYDLVVGAQDAYTPTMVNGMIDQLMVVYPRLVHMLRVIAPKVIDELSLGAGITGDLTDAVAKPAIKSLATNVLNILDNPTRIREVINELKDGFMQTAVNGVTVDFILSDVALQLQVDHTKVAPLLQALVDGLKADPAEIGIASNAIKDFAGKVSGEKTLALLNDVLNQNLTILLTSHSIRDLLHHPVKYAFNSVTVDLWAILDGIQPLMPDGTPVPPEAKPSALAKPLIIGTLMTADGKAQDVAGLKTGLIAKSDDLVKLLLRFGIQDII